MKVVNIIFFVVCALSIPKIWQSAKGVSEHQFSYRLSSHLQDPMSEDVKSVMAQPFSYWNEGSQFYVFLSQDQRWVLKIPRASKMREGLIDQITLRRSKKPDVLNSLSIAASLRSQTALLYAHYGKSAIPPVVFIDRLRRRHVVDLNSIPFALQEKKELMSHALLRANRHEREKILLAYLDLIDSEKKKGWMNRDCAFWLNFSYDAGMAARLDVGSYIPLEKKFSWRKATKPAVHWLKQEDPVLSAWFEKELQKRD